jgi:GTPase Era involved in 16S rRNA processing
MMNIDPKQLKKMMEQMGIKTTEKGQIIFIDNPGIHKPLHTLNKRMMSFVHSALQTSDLICLLIDATQPFGHGDEFVIETLKKEQEFLLFQHTLAAADSKYLILNLRTGKGMLKYRGRILRIFALHLRTPKRSHTLFLAPQGSIFLHCATM